MKQLLASFVLLALWSGGCKTAERGSLWTGDSYLPARRIEAEGFAGSPEVAYVFTKAQIAAMAQVKIDTNRLVTYLEARWPLERLRSFCTPENALKEDFKNLWAPKAAFATEIHQADRNPFDRVFVYGTSDDGKGTYVGEAGTQWRRWKYSLNVHQGTNHWAIIDALPNDFMDSPQYGPVIPSK